MSYQIEDVVNWFLAKEEMTPKKLQKILYYAYSWYLTMQNDNIDQLEDRLFNANFEAWVHGPVVPEVYHMFRDRGYNTIERYTGLLPEFDDDTLDVLEQVWNEYGNYTGNQLESITHQESPWQKAREGYLPLDRCNEIIKDEDIFECYIQRVQ